MIAASRFGLIVPADDATGQGPNNPYAPVMVATGPNYTFDANGGLDSGGRISGGTYYTQASPYAMRKPVSRVPNGTKAPCGCSGMPNVSAIPWWGWALIAVGVVAIFRRVT